MGGSFVRHLRVRDMQLGDTEHDIIVVIIITATQAAEEWLAGARLWWPNVCDVFVSLYEFAVSSAIIEYVLVS